MRHKAKHIKFFICLLLSLIGLAFYTQWAENAYCDLSFDTGVALLVLFLLLTAYNLKKRLSVLPLGLSRKWTEIHVFMGYFTVALFMVHVDFSWPNGFIEVILYSLYWMVLITGILGLFITRLFPRRLTTKGDEVVYQDIPMLRRKLRDEAENIIFSIAETSGSDFMIEFYRKEFIAFFTVPQNFLLHLAESKRPLRQLFDKVDDISRYCNEEEVKYLESFKVLIKKKDTLDYHYSLQGLLKAWLFIHIPLSYSLLAFGLFHGMLVMIFRGRIPA